VLVQIYGITTAGDAAAVNALGPDNVGLVLDEGIHTWDSVSDLDLPALRRELTDVAVVALSLSSDPERIRRTADAVQPAIVHLARAAGIDLDELAALRDDLAPVELMSTVPVRDDSSIDLARRLASVSDHLLLDSTDASGTVGATGLTHDWSLSARLVAEVAVPVFLAGGLGPDNVVEAIEVVGPAGVDSETHTSRRDDRRRKDLARVEAFIERARTTRPRREGFASGPGGG
jgi:phosphoribosylanthranilate isomerase